MGYNTMRMVLLFLILTVVPTTILAQENPGMEKADQFFQEQKWAEAAKAYETVAQTDSQDGTVWLRLGLAYHHLKKYDKAIAAYDEANNLGFALWRTRYNLACAHALNGNVDQAFVWLEQALEAGFGGVNLLETDADLVGLRDDPRFKSVLKRADKNARPCEFDPKYREFDFWVGEWDVFNKAGQQIGSNIISKDLNGCLIFEHWTSVSGGSGKSMNYYDPIVGKWKQVWVDARGGVVRYAGEVIDGVMQFEGENIDKDGNRQLARVVLKPAGDGRVRHLIEQSRDGGETWYVYFDGMYVPRKESSNDSSE